LRLSAWFGTTGAIGIPLVAAVYLVTPVSGHAGIWSRRYLLTPGHHDQASELLASGFM
jgi:hypothetical protein